MMTTIIGAHDAGGIILEILTGRMIDRVIDTNDEGRNHRARGRGQVGVLFPREQGHERHDT